MLGRGGLEWKAWCVSKCVSIFGGRAGAIVVDVWKQRPFRGRGGLCFLSGAYQRDRVKRSSGLWYAARARSAAAEAP